MDNNISEELIGKFLAGQCSAEELSDIRDWIKQFPDEAKRLFEMEKMYDAMKAKSMPKEKVLLAEQRLMGRIEDMQAEEAERHHAHVIRMWRRAAAIAVVCVLGALGWFYLQRNPMSQREMMVATASAERDTTVVLPDGTKVWLNKSSSIKYPKEFEKDNRKVALEGEGYFEVTKNRHQPFIVESDVMSVKVLGTVFNFKVDKAKRMATVSLLEGEVKVAGNHEEGMVVLAPGQKACVDANRGRMTVSEAEVYQDALWHEHKTAFSNANIKNIARMLEQIYHVQVVVDPDIDMGNTYSGVIKEKETIDSTLDLLQNTLPIKYKVRGNKVFLTK